MRFYAPHIRENGLEIAKTWDLSDTDDITEQFSNIGNELKEFAEENSKKDDDFAELFIAVSTKKELETKSPNVTHFTEFFGCFELAGSYLQNAYCLSDVFGGTTDHVIILFKRKLTG